MNPRPRFIEQGQTYNLPSKPLNIVSLSRDDLKDAHHERYHGERTVESITNWARHFVDQATKKAPKSHNVDHNADGDTDSHVGVGCLVAGLLHVQRAPVCPTFHRQS
jgi:hypothetical protein